MEGIAHGPKIAEWAIGHPLLPFGEGDRDGEDAMKSTCHWIRHNAGYLIGPSAKQIGEMKSAGKAILFIATPTLTFGALCSARQGKGEFKHVCCPRTANAIGAALARPPSKTW